MGPRPRLEVFLHRAKRRLFKDYVRQKRIRDRQPVWGPLLGQVQGLPSPGEPSKRILLATSVGAYGPEVTIESALAVALRLRGAHVDALLCDAALPACQVCTIARPAPEQLVEDGPQPSNCPGCFKPAANVYRSLQVPVLRYGKYLDQGDRDEARQAAARVSADEIRGLTVDGIAVGEHAFAGTARYFASGTFSDEPRGTDVLRRYLEAAMLTAKAADRILRSGRYDCAVFHHGIYVPQGVIGEVARARRVRVVNWAGAYRTGTFLFSHGNSYHLTLADEPEEAWADFEWDDDLEADLLGYLRSRGTGVNDWVSYASHSEQDLGSISREVGVDFSKPCVGLLTNVMWDAQLFYPSNAFANMLEWVLDTIRSFGARPDLQLLIRIHPAEVRSPYQTRQKILTEIQRAFAQLPPNVFVVPPESSISTYAAMQQCDAVLIYGTKTGLELAAVGLPVIVAGEAWVRNKGFTLDASSAEEYHALLDRLPLGTRLEGEVLRRARKYAYHFFFRRMIPLDLVGTTGDDFFRLKLESIDQLGPGRSVGLDVICDGILAGAPFVFPAEHHRDAHQQLVQQSAQ